MFDMDEGRISGTSDIWDATEIRHEWQVKDLHWRCPGCHLRTYPAAWSDPDRFKVTAHFKKFPNTAHDVDCLYDEVTRAGPQKLAWGAMGRPQNWIDRIEFPDPGAPVDRGTGDGPPHVPVVHSSTRRSLTGACRFHYAIKGSRFNWPLTVTDVPGTNYFDVFEPFRSRPAEPATRIWFGELFMKDPPIEVGDTIEIAVAGRVRIIADTGGWSQFQRSVLVSRIMEERRRWLKKKGDMPQAYVLARRHPDDPDVLHFDDPRKFALVRPD